MGGAGYKYEQRNGEGYLVDEFRQAVELLVERRFDVGEGGSVACHVSDFGFIAHSVHFHTSVTVHDHRRAQYAVGGISGFPVKVGFVGRFMANGLAGK